MSDGLYAVLWDSAKMQYTSPSNKSHKQKVQKDENIHLLDRFVNISKHGEKSKLKYVLVITPGKWILVRDRGLYSSRFITALFRESRSG